MTEPTTPTAANDKTSTVNKKADQNDPQAANKAAPKKSKPKPKGAKRLDLARLKTLAAEVAEYPATHDLFDLVHKFEIEHDMKIKNNALGGKTVTLAGLEVSGFGENAAVLRTWSNAARRAVLQGQ